MNFSASYGPILAAIGPGILYIIIFSRLRISIAFWAAAVAFGVAALSDLFVIPIVKAIETVEVFSGLWSVTVLRAFILAGLPEETALVSIVICTSVFALYKGGDQFVRGRQAAALVVAVVLGQAFGERTYRFIIDPTFQNVVIRTLTTVFPIAINSSIVLFVQEAITRKLSLGKAIILGYLVSLASHTLLDATIFMVDYMFRHHLLGFVQDLALYVFGISLSLCVGVIPALPAFRRLRRMLSVETHSPNFGESEVS